MPKTYNCIKHKLAFSLIELMVVIAIVALIATVAVPIYKANVNEANITDMVNKLGSFKLELMDSYTATGAWPSSINSTSAGSTNADSFFSNATNFRYNNSSNIAWFGYKLSSGYGTGWIFMVVQANNGGIFEAHCGSMDSSCTYGYCNSSAYFPPGCSETGLASTYSISSI